MTRDGRLILAAQGVRAFAYGLGAVLLGTTLGRRGLSGVEVGGVLAAVVAGSAVSSMAVGRLADRMGRRRWYAALYVALGLGGAVFAESSAVWLLVVVALTGALSTEVVESGPFTTLEQTMLATTETVSTVRGFGAYNAVAAIAGSLGALAAGGPGLAHHLWRSAPSDERWFWLFVPAAVAGVIFARLLSPEVEMGHPRGAGDVTQEAGGAAAPTRAPAPERAALSTRAAVPERASFSGPHQRRIAGLAALFALDSFAGGFVVQSFIAFWLAHRFGAGTGTIGALFFGLGLLQTVSFVVAARIGERFGLLETMVLSHLPSNVMLIGLAVTPSLVIAIVLLSLRSLLAQMDVPTRQAYVMAIVEPGERTAAAATTNTARYVTRPAGPVIAGAAVSSLPGLPFAIAGGVKIVYDLVLWGAFRRVPVPGNAGRARE